MKIAITQNDLNWWLNPHPRAYSELFTKVSGMPCLVARHDVIVYNRRCPMPPAAIDWLDACDMDGKRSASPITFTIHEN